MILHRKNDKDVWRDELWTLRDFPAGELLLVPLTSQIKETHLTKEARAPICIPKHGPGRHPEKKDLAFDGRSRTQMSKIGSVDAEGHKGNLFWLVGRTSDKKEANMEFDQVAFDLTLNFALPNKKRKLTASCGSSDLPAIPVLTNRNSIKAHTRLAYIKTENTNDIQSTTYKFKPAEHKIAKYKIKTSIDQGSWRSLRRGRLPLQRQRRRSEGDYSVVGCQLPALSLRYLGSLTP